MKTKVITAKEYARLSGLSPESGIISRRLREYEKTGTLKEMPGVIGVKRHGYTWAIQVLMSWVDGKEAYRSGPGERVMSSRGICQGGGIGRHSIGIPS